MNAFTVFDLAVTGVLLATILGACLRGLGREFLHTVLFFVGLAGGYFYMKDMAGPVSPAELSRLTMMAGFYLVALYALVWGLMRVIVPLMLDSGHPLSFKSRFWAGLLNMLKLATAIGALNLWYAVNNPLPHPERLRELPELLRKSLLVQLSDNLTERLYLHLAEQGTLVYAKTTDVPTEEPTPSTEPSLLQNVLTLGPVSPTVVTSATGQGIEEESSEGL